MTSGEEGRRMETGRTSFLTATRDTTTCCTRTRIMPRNDYITRLIQRHAPGARTILELGSGTGMHAGLLADRGFSVHGIERSAVMFERSLAVAQRVNVGAGRCRLEFTAADIRTVRLDRQFDTVASLFHVVSYQTSNADAIATLTGDRPPSSEARRGVHLRHLVRSRRAGAATRGPCETSERRALGLDAHRRAHPALQREYRGRDLSTVCKIACRRPNGRTYGNPLDAVFLHAGIELLAARSGFELRHAESWMTGAPIHQGAWSICVVLQAQ